MEGNRVKNVLIAVLVWLFAIALLYIVYLKFNYLFNN